VEAARRSRAVEEAEARELALRRAAIEERRMRQEAEAREAEARAAEAWEAEAREEAREEARRKAVEQEERRAKAARARAQAETAAAERPPSGKWVGRGHNKQNGFNYRVTFYLTFGDDGRVTGVAVPPNAFQDFGRVNMAGMLDSADDTCKLDHTQQAGWTKCRFRTHGQGWEMHCDWNMCNLMGWYGTHDLTFSGDTRTTPGGFSLF